MVRRKVTNGEIFIALGKLIVVVFFIGLILVGVEGTIILTGVMAVFGYFLYRNAEVDDPSGVEEETVGKDTKR